MLPPGRSPRSSARRLSVYATGGFDSPVEQIPVFVVVYSACFLSSRFTALCVVGAVAVHELPLLYDAHARAQSVVADSLSAVLVFASLAAVVVAGRVLLVRVSEEHAVMRELATAVAAGMPPADVFVLASRRIAALLGVDGCGIVEFTSSESAVVAGAWAERRGARAGARARSCRSRRGDDMHRVYTEGRAVRVDRHAPGKRAARMGYGCSLTSPLPVRGRLWGVISVASVAPESLPPDAERVLDDFAELIGLAVANTEAHAVLVEQAATDPLTRLANHRAFHERLREELSARAAPRAAAHPGAARRRPLQGDQRLARPRARRRRARRGRRHAERRRPHRGRPRPPGRRRVRASSCPRPSEEQALAAVERARGAIAAIELGTGLRVTVSAGVCGLEHAGDPDALVRLADGALYWGKAHGRDAAWVYDPEVVRELSISERADQLQRTQALVGIRALARAIDAKDQSTREHSQRVATLAVRDRAPAAVERRPRRPARGRRARARRGQDRHPRRRAAEARRASPTTNTT